MFAQIIQQFQEFKQTYSKCPNVLYVNPEHYAILRERYSEMFSDERRPDVIVPLQIKVVIVPKGLLRHPRVACILPGTSQIFNCKTRRVFGRSHGMRSGPMALYGYAHGV